MDYNLLEEKWIPVLYKDGNSGRVGIIEAFAQAGRIRQIAASNPMDRVAILRFLLALLYWCMGNPLNSEASIFGDSFPSDWFKKLDDNKHRFNLLDDKKGFYQDHTTSGKAVAATNLLHDLPSGSKIAHFRHVRDFREGLCPSCCAMGLLRWASVASAGTAGAGQSMTASINGNTPAYSIRMGATLLETLRLSWPISKSVKDDAPLWEGASEKSPLGILKGLTWQSRRILLAPPDAQGNRDFSVGSCCYCGNPTDRLVKSILFRPGWQRPSKEPWSDDPHLLRVVTKDVRGREKKIIPLWPSPNDPLEDHAATWRSDLPGLLQQSAGGQTGPVHFHTTLIGTSQALYKHVETHAVTMPTLNPSTALDLLNELGWLRQLIWNAASARTVDWHKRPRGHAVIDTLCSTAAKGHAIRSSLCAASFLAEKQLEEAFAKLTQELGSADPKNTILVGKSLQDWKEAVCRIFSRDIEHVADLTARGSPLRRREAKDRATAAVLNAVRRKRVQ